MPPAPRNREPVFITVGSLSAQRKNHNLLIEALQTIYHEGHRDFSVIIVGKENWEKFPATCAPSCMSCGKLDFPAMYEAMRRADYFLPLLDPGNPAHDRYITTGITGSALLIYGFAKIPVIHENSLPSTASMTGTHFFTGKKRLAAPCSAPSGKRRRNTRKCSRRFSNWAGISTGNPAPT